MQVAPVKKTTEALLCNSPEHRSCPAQVTKLHRAQKSTNSLSADLFPALTLRAAISRSPNISTSSHEHQYTAESSDTMTYGEGKEPILSRTVTDDEAQLTHLALLSAASSFASTSPSHFVDLFFSSIQSETCLRAHSTVDTMFWTASSSSGDG